MNTGTPQFIRFLTFTKSFKKNLNSNINPVLFFLKFKDLYGSFDYSTVLFLSDYVKDSNSGRLIFIDMDNNNRTVEPRKGQSSLKSILFLTAYYSKYLNWNVAFLSIGRAIAFTSGEESRHFHEKVSKGSRIALTVGFSCDPKKAKKDPLVWIWNLV